MSVYKVLRSQDRATTSLVASSRLYFVTGSAGWRGSLGVSASVYLIPGRASRWGGPASFRQYQSVRSYTIDGTYDVFRNYPVTASVQFRLLRPDGQASGDEWGREHWGPLERLYDYYGRTGAQYTTGSGAPYFKVFSVPRAMYGRQIRPGSVVVTDNTYTSGSSQRVLVDDSRGALKVSGSDLQVGNVFYNEGFITVTHASYVEMGDSVASSLNPTDLVSLDFMTTQMTPSTVLMCRTGGSELNCSNNPTYSEVDARGRRVSKRADGTTYITRITIYDREKRVVGIAKLAQPIRKREGERLNVRIPIDF